MARRTKAGDEGMLFSERGGHVPVRAEVQKGGLDEATIARLWNAVYRVLGRGDISEMRKDSWGQRNCLSG